MREKKQKYWTLHLFKQLYKARVGSGYGSESATLGPGRQRGGQEAHQDRRHPRHQELHREGEDQGGEDQQRLQAIPGTGILKVGATGQIFIFFNFFLSVGWIFGMNNVF